MKCVVPERCGRILNLKKAILALVEHRSMLKPVALIAVGITNVFITLITPILCFHLFHILSGIALNNNAVNGNHARSQSFGIRQAFFCLVQNTAEQNI